MLGEIIENFEEQRINILLGANGSGKSTFLKQIVEEFKSSQRVIYVEGGRTIQLPGRLSDMMMHDPLERIEKEIENQNTKSLSGRLGRLIGVLYKKAADADLKFLRGKKLTGEVITDIPKTQLDSLFELFNEVFPEISLIIKESKDEIYAIQEDSYPINKLSDGEKQCLALLCDLLNQSSVPDLIVVDEPELNLNPKLAVKFWESIEAYLPDTRFIYATHNILFSIRDEIDQICILSKICEPSFFNKSDLQLLPELDDFLGSLPSILAYSKVILCEGEDASKFDESFYRWILADKKIGVFAVKNCHSVIAASKSFPQLSRVLGDKIKVLGIVDGDGKNNQDPSYYRLNLDECESYLCLPEIIAHLLKKPIGQCRELVTETILKLYDEIMFKIWARQITREKTRSIALSLPRKEVAQITSREDFIDKIQSNRDSQVNWIAEYMSDESIIKVIDKIENSINELSKNGSEENILACLKFIPGKELLDKIVPQIEVKNKENILNMLQDLEVTNIPELLEIKTTILKELK